MYYSLFIDLLLIYLLDHPYIPRLTFVWGNAGHRDPAAIEVSEHDFRDAIVSQSVSGIPIPLVLRHRNYRPHRSQETTIQVL